METTRTLTVPTKDKLMKTRVLNNSRNKLFAYIYGRIYIHSGMHLASH